MDVSHEKLEAFAAASRRVGAHGLVRCSSGNLSCRLDQQHMLIKASRAWMAELTADDVAACRLADGASLNGKPPSVEIGFHAGVLRTRADVNAVLHFQAPAATTLACRSDLGRINFAVIPEIVYYIGAIAVVPYLLPGSAALAEAVTAVMKSHDLAVLASHGQVVVGKNVDDAIQKAVFFELACEILVRGGKEVQSLSTEAAAELRPGVSQRRGV
jgi:ribulose-5-phosphate 4-epimerase/fuculose-1-phosphate aldolase